MKEFAWNSMNWVDYTIIVVIVFSILISLVRGFIREAISLGAWLLAALVGYRYTNSVSAYFVDYLKTPSIRYVVVFLGLFFAILILGAIVNYLFSNLINKTGLSGTDRVIGLVFGFARGVLLVSALILAGTLTSLPKQAWWTQSQMIPQFEGIVAWLKTILPEKLNQIDLNQVNQNLDNAKVQAAKTLSTLKDQ